MLTLYLVVLLVAIPLFKTKISPLYISYITIGALIIATVLTAHNIIELGTPITNLVVNPLILYIECFIYMASAACLIINTNKISHEYSLIIVFSIIGATLIISATNILTLYLGIELQSFGLYILAALYYNLANSVSAALKYFLLGALASSTILLGIAILYSYTGTVSYEELSILVSVPSDYDYNILFGIGLVLVGLLFKTSAAPFHSWAPDVYDNTPNSVTTYLIVVPKLAYITVIGILSYTFIIVNSYSLLNLSAGLSLVIGAVIGISQPRIKRMLTYSTINHLGFILLAFQGDWVFYIIQYTVTNLATFMAITAMGIVLIYDLKGLGSSHPILALTITVLLLSAAGVPPVVGFFAKYSVLYSLIITENYTLAVLGVLTSIVSAVYYLGTISTIYFSVGDNVKYNLSSSTSYIIASLTLFVITFWIYPNLIINCTELIALHI